MNLLNEPFQIASSAIKTNDRAIYADDQAATVMYGHLLLSTPGKKMMLMTLWDGMAGVHGADDMDGIDGLNET